MLLDSTSVGGCMVYVWLGCTIPERSGVCGAELATLRQGTEAAEGCGTWNW